MKPCALPPSQTPRILAEAMRRHTKQNRLLRRPPAVMLRQAQHAGEALAPTAHPLPAHPLTIHPLPHHPLILSLSKDEPSKEERPQGDEQILPSTPLILSLSKDAPLSVQSTPVEGNRQPFRNNNYLAEDPASHGPTIAKPNGGKKPTLDKPRRRKAKVGAPRGNTNALKRETLARRALLAKIRAHAFRCKQTCALLEAMAGI